jgi:hypothetical protein
MKYFAWLSLGFFTRRFQVSLGPLMQCPMKISHENLANAPLPPLASRMSCSVPTERARVEPAMKMLNFVTKVISTLTFNIFSVKQC